MGAPGVPGSAVPISLTDHALHVARTFVVNYEQRQPDDVTNVVARQALRGPRVLPLRAAYEHTLRIFEQGFGPEHPHCAAQSGRFAKKQVAFAHRQSMVAVLEEVTGMFLSDGNFACF